MRTWAELVEKTTFAVPFPMRLRIDMSRGEEVIVIEVDTYDVKTGNAGTFYHWSDVPPLDKFKDGAAIAFLRQRMQDVLLHELDESLRVDGKQVADPHFSRGGECTVCENHHRRIEMIDRRRRIFRCSEMGTLDPSPMEHPFPEGLL